MRNTLVLLLTIAAACSAQITMPEGTPVRVRLEQTLSSATVATGASIEFAVTQAVEIGGVVVIGDGARATGTVTKAVERGRIARGGKFDFTIDRVMAVDGKWVPLRHAQTKERGDGRFVTFGIMAAGIGPFALLIKGKDATVEKGSVFEVFADENVLVSGFAPGSAKPAARGLLATYQAQPGSPSPAGQPTNIAITPSGPVAMPVAYQDGGASAPAMNGSEAASVTITSLRAGADIEVDGAFVGSTPSTIKLSAGAHEILVSAGSRVWQRNVRVTAGSSITLDADLGRAASVRSLPVRSTAPEP